MTPTPTPAAELSDDLRAIILDSLNLFYRMGASGEPNDSAEYADRLAALATRELPAASLGEVAVAFSVVGPDGANSIGGQWMPIDQYTHFEKFVVLREGHRVVYAYPEAAPAPSSAGDDRRAGCEDCR